MHGYILFITAISLTFFLEGDGGSDNFSIFDCYVSHSVLDEPQVSLLKYASASSLGNTIAPSH